MKSRNPPHFTLFAPITQQKTEWVQNPGVGLGERACDPAHACPRPRALLCKDGERMLTRRGRQSSTRQLKLGHVLLFLRKLCRISEFFCQIESSQIAKLWRTKTDSLRNLALKAGWFVPNMTLHHYPTITHPNGPSNQALGWVGTCV